MSEITDLADALVTDLVANIADLPVTREYSVDIDRKDLTETVVYVIPIAERDGISSRYSNEREFDLQILILSPLTIGTAYPYGTTELDDEMDRAESIKTLFVQDGVLRDKPQNGATWVGMTHEPIWDQQRLKAGRFATSITLTYAKHL